MGEKKHIGPDPTKQYSYEELPIGDVIIGKPPAGRPTGFWRYHKPAYAPKTPPCQGDCPLGNWITGFLGAMERKSDTEARSVLALETPFPATLGRACYHFCEYACNRKELDGAVTVQGVERFLADKFSGESYEEPPAKEKNGRKIGVVGGGPAGLACAYFGTMLGYDVTIHEASDKVGGIPGKTVPEYRLPKEVYYTEIDNILARGVEVRTNCRVGVDVTMDELRRDFDAVFVAVGAGVEIMMDKPGSEGEGVYPCLSFLNMAKASETPELGSSIVVIGGGNSAIDAARVARRLGVKNVHLLYRRSREEMPADEEEIRESIDEGVLLHMLSDVSEIKLAGGRVAGVVVQKMELGEPDDSGRRRPRPVEGETSFLEVSSVIHALGQKNDLEFAAQVGLPLTQWDNIEADGVTLQTSLERVFAGGDAIDQNKTITHAVGAAKRAVIAIDHYLSGDDLQALAEEGKLARTMRVHLNRDEKNRDATEIAKVADLNLNYMDHSPRNLQSEEEPDYRIQSFIQAIKGLTDEEAHIEASRCLSCGVCRDCGNCYLFCPDSAVKRNDKLEQYWTDYRFCKGCMTCKEECPCGCIAQVKED